MLHVEQAEHKPALVLAPKRVVRHSTQLDTVRRYLTDAPTPTKFAATLKSVDDGDLAAIVELAEEMEGKDAHLQNVAARRRESLTALEWDIVPDTADPDSKAGEEAAQFAREQLDGLKSWPEALEHLALAIGPGISLLELVWWKGRLVDTIEVPGHRLTGSISNEAGVFVLTDDDQSQGVKATKPKFVVYTPNARAGFPVRVSITRAQAYLFVIKHFSLASWVSFAEVYGQPIRVARFSSEATPEEQSKVQAMLENMGQDMWAMFSDAVDLEFKEAARGNQPFEGLVDWVERKQSILYLGQTLTTEQGSVGSLALGRVHENVRASITLSDIAKERRAIRRSILTPMTRFRWPNRAMPVPHFQRRVAEPLTLEEDTLTLEKMRYLDERNLALDDATRYELLKMPMPSKDDASL